jgi:ubiquitin-protein ligase
MATPDDVRRARLAADYEEMRTIRGPVIHWQSNDVPPADYIVTFNVRSYLSPTTTRDEHRIRILLSPNHPFEKPTVMMHAMTPIFHPHVWPDGKVCIGHWDYREGLASFVVKLARLFQFDPQLIDPYSIANYKAADWFYANPTLFPRRARSRRTPSSSSASHLRRATAERAERFGFADDRRQRLEMKILFPGAYDFSY